MNGFTMVTGICKLTMQNKPANALTMEMLTGLRDNLTELHNNPKSFQSQCEWLRDDKGVIDIDFTGRFESIASDFERIAAHIAPGARLPHLNASKRRDYRTYYDAGSRERVERWFAEDIERFEYRFD